MRFSLAVALSAVVLASGCGGDPAVPGLRDAEDVAQLDAPDADAAVDATDAAPDVATDATDSAVAPCQVVADCPLPPACHVAVCQADGLCATTLAEDALPCDDGNACTIQDACLTGVCQGGAARDCDDTNACTSDSCSPGAGCVHLAVAASTACDDGDNCTVGDVCAQGVCQAGVNTCQCKTTSDCGGLEDGDQCNGTLFCDTTALPFTCKLNPASVVNCPSAADSACQKNTCVPATGACKLMLAPTNTACDDGDACTQGDVCEGGLCSPGTNTCFCKTTSDCATFEDGDKCNGTLFCNKAVSKCELNPLTIVTCQTVDDTGCSKNQCNPKLGKCFQTPVAEGKPCNDGNACTPNEACSQGTCKAAANTCECQADADCAGQNAKDKCKGQLYCDLGSNHCVLNPASVVHCQSVDDTACVKNLCDPGTGQCGLTTLGQDGSACDDGNPCTTGEACKSGTCEADVNANVCECEADADCVAKEDGNLCNGTLYCDKSTPGKHKCVVNPATVVECTQAFDTTCEAFQCVPKTGKCAVTPVHQGNACTEDLVCTGGGWCNLGTCEAGQNTCACISDADCGKFEDGDVCNGTLFCDKTGSAPVCKVNPATVLSCPSVGDTACSKNLCQKTSGQCAMTAVAGPCDDEDACTVSDACVAGACKGLAKNCDDGDACNLDVCKAPQGCAHLPLGATACDDGNPCTNDGCDKASGCQHTPGAGVCDDGDACTNGDLCKAGVCGGSKLACDDGNPCTDDGCVSAQGCVHPANAAPCSDGSKCTSGDVCKGGVCSGGVSVACDDGNPCTQDFCDAKDGCVQAANAKPCDDGNSCTASDSCKAGVCTGLAAACDDANPCTDDACDAQKGCTHANNAVQCSDGNACTSGDVCAAGKCAGGAKLTCDDKNPCSDDSCDPKSGCVSVANTAACDDGNPCTAKDICLQGTCTGQATCEDGNACTDDGCDPVKGCSHLANSVPCNDGNACTLGDACAVGKCAPGKAVSCDDSNACTTDACDAATGCIHGNSAAACDDANACTKQDACTAGQCTGAKVTCDDGNPCTTDACDLAKGCTATANTLPCSDNNACTAGDACKGGICTPGQANGCDDKNACTVDSCLSATGQCQNIDTSAQACNDGNPCTDDACGTLYGCGHLNNTKACDDGNPCTLGDTCGSGKCGAGGTKLDCDDKQPCTDDSCDPSQGCVHVNNTAGCNDGLACTAGDKCSGGQCKGTPGCTADTNPCDDEVCDVVAGACIHVANGTTTCNDGDPCTTKDLCKDGKCISLTPVNCDDQNVCTDDACDKFKGCVHANNTGPCTIYNSCSTGDACNGAGGCLAGKPKLWQTIAQYTAGTSADRAYAVAAQKDGLLVVGSTMLNGENTGEYPYLVRTDLTGAIKYTALPKDYAPGGRFVGVLAQADGSWLAGGMFTKDSQSSPNFGAYKLDSSGATVATKLMAAQPFAVQTAYALAALPGGGAVLCGDQYFNANVNTAKILCAQLDSGANFIGNALTTPTEAGLQSIHALTVLADGTLVGAGVSTATGNADALLMVMVPLQTPALYHFGTAAGEVAHAIAPFGDGTFLIAGSVDTNGGDVWYARVSLTGTKLWSATGGTTTLDEVHTILPVTDGWDIGGILGDPAYGSSKGMTWHVDHDGRALVKRTFGPFATATGFLGVVPTDDGGAVYVGYSYQTSGKPPRRLYITRLDQFGDDTCSASPCSGFGKGACNDGNPCTDDGCMVGGGCSVAANTETCDDGDACTAGDSCFQTCKGTAIPPCNDNNPCTSNGCDKVKGCVSSPLADGFACASGKTCQLGVCK